MMPYYAQKRANARLTKAMEVASRDAIARERMASTPDRTEPVWVTLFWRVRRMLRA